MPCSLPAARCATPCAAPLPPARADRRRADVALRVGDAGNAVAGAAAELAQQQAAVFGVPAHGLFSVASTQNTNHEKQGQTTFFEVARQAHEGSSIEEASRKTGAKAAAQPAPDAAPDAARGRKAIHQYACVTCHAIPGIVGPNAPVGPPLAAIGTRGFIAGVLPNTPQNMVRWLRHPQAVNPRSAMPDLGVTERDAHDIAAYLSTLR
jgi:cytochrome c2